VIEGELKKLAASIGPTVPSKLSDIVFGRSQDYHKVFISAQMRGNVLKDEREAAVQAVDSFGLTRAWAWERDAAAGPYSAESVCIEHARTSDSLVLILAEELTPVTRKEYMAARDEGATRYVFIKEGCIQTAQVKSFINKERAHALVTKKFRNVSELQTHITTALRERFLYAPRLMQEYERLLQHRGKMRGSRKTAVTP
jgi:hypothetical protein